MRFQTGDRVKVPPSKGENDYNTEDYWTTSYEGDLSFALPEFLIIVNISKRKRRKTNDDVISVQLAHPDDHYALKYKVGWSFFMEELEHFDEYVEKSREMFEEIL